jgi:NADH-quinone oxidoreductase subunit H
MHLLYEILVFPGIGYLLLVSVGLYWVFRKFLAPMHKRVGPHFNGPAGSLQTLFDLSKLMSKESITPSGVNPYLFSSLPLITLIIALLPTAFIPWTASVTVVPSAYGLVAFVVLVGIEPFLLFLAGFSSNNKYAFLGGIRVLVQMISMETAFFLACLSPAVLFGTLNLQTIVEKSSWESFFILLPGFILYLIAFIGMLEQPPFDIPEAEQEIVYGFYTEYSGTNYFLLQLMKFAEFSILFTGGATLFLGGYKGIFFDGYFFIFLKMLVMLFFMVVLRAGTPRITMRQMLAFSWRYLVVLSILNIAWVFAAQALFFKGGG